MSPLSVRAVGIGLGWLADRWVADPPRCHPVAGFGELASALERALWRPRRRAGAVHTALLVGVSVLGGWGAERRVLTDPSRRLALVALATWVTLGGRSLEREAAGVAELAMGDLPGARTRVSALVGRDPSGMGTAELCRAAIESVAENTADAVIGPLFWGAILGPAGALGYRAANTLDAMVGHRSARYRRFGWAAARLDDVLTWPAARLGALLTVALAWSVGGSSRCAWRALVRDGWSHPSPNAGLLEAAFAGALGVRLGGRNSYPSGVQWRPLLGDVREARAPTPADVLAAVRLSRVVGAPSAVAAVVLAAGGERR